MISSYTLARWVGGSDISSLIQLKGVPASLPISWLPSRLRKKSPFLAFGLSDFGFIGLVRTRLAALLSPWSSRLPTLKCSHYWTQLYAAKRENNCRMKQLHSAAICPEGWESKPDRRAELCSNSSNYNSLSTLPLQWRLTMLKVSQSNLGHPFELYVALSHATSQNRVSVTGTTWVISPQISLQILYAEMYFLSYLLQSYCASIV
jgi:hypothetical protein